MAAPKSASGQECESGTGLDSHSPRRTYLDLADFRYRPSKEYIDRLQAIFDVRAKYLYEMWAACQIARPERIFNPEVEVDFP